MCMINDDHAEMCSVMSGTKFRRAAAEIHDPEDSEIIIGSAISIKQIKRIMSQGYWRDMTVWSGNEWNELNYILNVELKDRTDHVAIGFYSALSDDWYWSSHKGARS